MCYFRPISVQKETYRTSHNSIYIEKILCKWLEIFEVVSISLLKIVSTVFVLILYTPVKSYVVKQPQKKWACDFHDDAPPLSFQLQVAEVIF